MSEGTSKSAQEAAKEQARALEDEHRAALGLPLLGESGQPVTEKPKPGRVRRRG